MSEARSHIFPYSGRENDSNAPHSGGNTAHFSNAPFAQGPGQFHAQSGPWFTNPTSTSSMGQYQDMTAQIGQTQFSDDDYDNEPPLLEELGINFEHIFSKTKSVLIPTQQISDHIMDDADLAGPLVFCFILGTCLLLSAKVHFGYIYGFGAFGCISMYLLMNLMSAESSIDIYRVCSVLGYCLLPIVGLAAFNSIVAVKGLGIIGFILAVISVLWSTHTAARFFEKALHMSEQRYLIAYPVCLVYSCFVLITVF